jgi:hypothetical protein
MAVDRGSAAGTIDVGLCFLEIGEAMTAFLNIENYLQTDFEADQTVI